MDIYLFRAFAPIFAHTSEENMVAQVPMHQHTTGLVIRPSLIPLQILYSSVPPICRKKECWAGSKLFTFVEISSEMHMEALLGLFFFLPSHWVTAEVSEQSLLTFFFKVGETMLIYGIHFFLLKQYEIKIQTFKNSMNSWHLASVAVI